MRPDIFLTDAMSKKILFWLGLFVVFMLIMVQPVRAETIPATITTVAATGFIGPYGGTGCMGSTNNVQTYCFNVMKTCMSYSVATDVNTDVVGGICQLVWAGITYTAPSYPATISCPSPSVLDEPSQTCRQYVCPTGQNWTLTGANCTRPDCVLPQIRNITTGVCGMSCPDDNLKGYRLSSTSSLPSPLPLSGAYLGCGRLPGQSQGCVSMVFPIASIFGITLASQTTTSESCSSGPVVDVPIIVSLADPQVTKFEDVVAKAPLVDPVKTEAAKTENATNTQAVEDHLSVVGAGITQAQIKATEKATAAEAVKKAAADLIAAPTADKLATYNQTINNYNTASQGLATAIQSAKSQYEQAAIVKSNADTVAARNGAVNQKNQDLLTAISASGQPYNSGQVNAATGDAAGLAAQNTALMSKLADAINRLSAASGSQTQLGIDNTAVTQAINDLAKQVNQVVNGANGTGTPPATPVPPVTSGGSGSGAASSVQGAAVDCVATPTAYGCTPATPPVDCVADPNNLACKKSECEKNPNLAMCLELGTVADDVPLGTKTVTVNSITPVAVGGVGACPAPLPMVLHGHTYFMKFDTYCEFSTRIKPIILVFAWLAAAGILVGGFRAA